MKAVLLVAGRGKRLKDVTDNIPKPFVTVNGKAIITNTLDALITYGFTDVIMITGYMDEFFRKKIGNQYKGLKINYIYCKDWANTNNAYGLSLAMDSIKDGETFMLIEGDEFFDHNIINPEIFSDSRSYWIGYKNDSITGCILSESISEDKKLDKLEIIRDPEELREAASRRTIYKSCGMLKITGKESTFFKKNLKTYASNPKNKQNYFDLFINENISKLNFYVYPIHTDLWYEIDDQKDLKRAEEIFS